MDITITSHAIVETMFIIWQVVLGYMIFAMWFGRY